MNFPRLFTAMLAAAALLGAPAGDEAARNKRLEWWRQARFGMFIHWGLYAIPAGEWNGKPVPGIGEWIMNRARIPVREYEKLAAQFNPVKFDADAWVKVAKDAGARYIVITSKHHDGFSLFDSKVTRYDIVDATPFKRDVLKELAEACRKQGMRLGFYYSQTQDWYEPDADGNTWDWPDDSKKDFAGYLERKVKPQLRELLTQYGPVALIWFDTPRRMTREQSQQLADLVHSIQPDCLVSGRVGNGVGDYDSARDNQITVGKVTRDWETPVTLNDTWGFKKNDHNWKSPTVLIRQLAQVASRGGNYLLNVGPTAEGVIPQPSVERLAAVGRWLKVNGESIYGASATPFPYELPWGVITSKPGRLYLHVFEWPKRELTIFGIRNKVTRAYLLAGRKAVPVKQSSEKAIDHHALTLTLPAQAPDPADSVIVLELSGNPDVVTSLLQQPDASVTLPAYLAQVHAPSGKPELRFDGRGVAERWTNKDEWLEWDFRVSKPGTFHVSLVTSEQKDGTNWEGGHVVSVEVAGQTLKTVIDRDERVENPSNPYWPYVRSNAGTVRIEKPGTYKVAVKPESIEAQKKLGFTLVSVDLKPAQ